MLINFSNHPSVLWSTSQIKAAEQFGEIMDIPFPDVSPAASEEEIKEVAQRFTGQILSLNPDAVLCQGEFTLAYAVISRLKENNIKVLAACTEREAEAVIDGDDTIKKAVFRFRGFREYL